MAQKLTFYLYHQEIGEREITEAFQSDSFAFSLEQDKGRFGRDVSIGGEEISLRFEAVFGRAISEAQTLPDGSVIKHLSMGLPYILHYWRLTGFETKIELRAKDYLGNVLGLGELDFSEGSFKTDGLTYVECKTFWQTNAVQIKRWQEAECDILSDKDRLGNPIQPVELFDIFLKALPIRQISSWHSPEDDTAVGITQVSGNEDSQDVIFQIGANNAQVTDKYDVERSLGYISKRYALVSGTGGGFYPNQGNNFTYLQAANQLSDIEINLTNVSAYAKQTALIGVGTTVSSATGRVRLIVNVGLLSDYNNPRMQYIVDAKNLIYNDPSDIPDTQYFDDSYTISIPLILRGEYLWIYLETDATAIFTGNGSNASYIVSGVMETMSVEISATATAVSSVTKAVKYVSLVEQPLLWINGTTLTAPRLRDGGFLGDVYAYNGYLLRGITDKPFSVTLKDRFERLKAFNLDYQVTRDNVFVGMERDFYPSVELGVYPETPDSDFNIETNERATCNIVEMKISGYLNRDEQDSTEQPTLSAVHTETQYTLPNERCDNILEVEVKDILDPVTEEEARKLAITEKPSTTGKYDDKVFLLDTVAVPEGSFWSETVYVQTQINEDGNLQILNGTVEAGGQQYYFDWRTLGFALHSYITIIDNQGSGASLEVIDWSFSVITFNGNGDIGEGKLMLTLTYPLNNVFLMNRTTEGFTLAQEGFSNQRFTPKRLLALHNESLANICRYHPSGEIRVSKPPINASFTTQLTSEATPVIENEPILVSTLPPPLITPNIINTRVSMSLAQADDLFGKLQGSSLVPTGEIGGYVTVQGEAGSTKRIYPKKLNYLPITEICEISGEEKQV